ncbi:MAG TPA: glucoamylase family protein [Armatimonadota bacterium]|jgi:hypothetical protein
MRLLISVILLALAAARPAAAITARDPFLDEVQRRSFLFFWNETDPVTGLTKDRSHNFEPDTYDVGSTAATGFALSAACIGAEHGWVTRARAQERVLLTLRWLEKDPDVRHGLYPHFIHFKTGERAWKCEYSTIDTALLLCGALTAGEYFGGETKSIAERLYRRVDWVYWSPRGFICHGSRPEEGEFLAFDYSGYSEALILYTLAIGSPTHPTDPAQWGRLGRWIARYGPYSSIAGSSLFVNQYPNLYVDFHHRTDGVADYWENARVNTLANRRFCIDQAANHKGYGPDVWGLTAGDGPDGYAAYSAEPGGAWQDGTVNPHAAGGSFMFTPVESRRALRAMLDRYRPRLWGRYGFSDGFNIDKDWWAQDVVGIDTGATLLSIENQRTGLIQRLFMKNAAPRAALKRIGFRPAPPKPALAPIRASGAVQLEPGSPLQITFHLPAKPAGWGKRPILLYGGVIEERTISVALNGRPLGAAEVPRGIAWPAALAVPADRLKWGAENTLVILLAGGGAAWYGPLWLGPKEGLDNKPLTVRVVG